MKNTTTIRTTLVLAAALGLVSSTMAFAQQGRSTQGYLTDQRNGIVKDPFNLCWRTGYWTPALSNCDCDVDQLERGELAEPRDHFLVELRFRVVRQHGLVEVE